MVNTWFTEDHTDGYKTSWLVSKILHRENSPYQEIAVLESPDLGRVLLLDNVIQTTTRFEYIYHEMIAHVPLAIHPNPKKVLIIGGGDGGTAREVLKHPGVEQIDLVEIDLRVIEVCMEWLPQLSSSLSSEKVNILIKDGLEYINNHPGKYDVILIDCTDPIGPSQELFSKAFYRDSFNALKEDGLMVTQTGSPLFSRHFLQAYKNIREVYPLTKPYLTCDPTYFAGYFAFTLGSKRYDYNQVYSDRFRSIQTEYYTPALHLASFVLPRNIERMIT